MGFQVPDNITGVTELTYLIVAIPDDIAYLRAAMGAYSDMANVWMWGEEQTHPQADEIRQQWLNAIDDTLEAYEMGGFATLLGYIDELETLLRAMEAVRCCDSNAVTFLPTEGIPDAGYTYDGETFPGTWGDNETIADIDDYREVLCAMSLRFVDYLANVGAQIDAGVTVGVLGISIVAGILAAMSGLGFLVAFAYADMAAITAALLSGATASLFTTASDAIESAREDISCAFLTGDAQTLSDEVENVVSALAWSLFFQHIDYQSAINAAQTGIWKGETIEIARDDTCDCQPSYQYDITFTFDSDAEGWTPQSRSGWQASTQTCASHPTTASSPNPTGWQLSKGTLVAAAGAGAGALYIDYISLDMSEDAASPNFFTQGKVARFYVSYEDTSGDMTTFTAEEVGAEPTVNPAKEIESGAPFALRMEGFSPAVAAQSQVLFDNVRVGFHVV